MSKPTIAITGANGFIGSQIVDYFSKKGWNVIALVRQPEIIDKPDNIQYKSYDLSHPSEESLLEGVDYLVHAAYIKHSSKNPEALSQNVDGTRDLLQISRKYHVKKNVLFSSLSAQYDAESIYGQQKHVLENIFNTKNDAIIRPGLVLGNGGLVSSMADFMRKKHLVPLVNGGNQPLQITDIDSIVFAIEKILTDDLHGSFTIASNKSYPYKTFYTQLAKAINTRIVFVPVPQQLLIYPIKVLEKININIGITTDNLLGLKKMRHINTTSDLKKLSLSIPSLKEILDNAVRNGL